MVKTLQSLSKWPFRQSSHSVYRDTEMLALSSTYYEPLYCDSYHQTGGRWEKESWGNLLQSVSRGLPRSQLASNDSRWVDHISYFAWKGMDEDPNMKRIAQHDAKPNILVDKDGDTKRLRMLTDVILPTHLRRTLCRKSSCGKASRQVCTALIRGDVTISSGSNAAAFPLISSACVAPVGVNGASKIYIIEWS